MPFRAVIVAGVEKQERLLVKVSEAAEMMGCSQGRVRELIKAGKLPSLRIDGTMIRIPLAELKSWIAAASQESTV